MAKKNYYAVSVGRQNGIYTSWDECSTQVLGFKGALYRGFVTLAEAEEFLAGHGSANKVVQSDTPVAEAMTKEKNAALALAKLEQPCDIWADAEVEEQKPKSNFNLDQEAAINAVNGVNLLFAIPGSGKTTVLVERAHRMVVEHHIPAEKILVMTFAKKAALEMAERYAKSFPEDASPNFCTIHSFCLNLLKDANRLTKDLVTDVSSGRGGYRKPNINTLMRQALDRVLKSAPRAYLKGIQQELEQEEDSKKIQELRLELERVRPLVKTMKEWECVDMSYQEGRSWTSLDYVGFEEQKTLQTAIGCLKNSFFFSNPKGYKLDELYVNIKETPMPLRPVYEAYEEELDKNNLMDFDDLLMETYAYLRENSYALQRLRQNYSYICLDEVQDTSPLQYDIVSLLTGPQGNLFMVGDDDQSIYSFRGAQPQEMLRFKDKWPQGKIYKMGINYRCGKLILSTAEHLVKKNKQRFTAKEMYAGRDEKGKISFKLAEDYVAQNRHLLDLAKEAREKQQSLAILARCNISLLSLLVSLHLEGIPTSCAKWQEIINLLKVNSLANARHILAFALQPQDWDLFKQSWLALINNYRVVNGNYRLSNDKKLLAAVEGLHRNMPKEHLLEVLCKVLQEQASQLGDWKVAALVKKVQAIKNELQSYVAMSPVTALQQLTENFSLLALDYMPEKMRYFGLLGIATCFKTLQGFVEETDRLCSKEWRPLEDTTAFPLVTLTTIHGAKGLEFDKVVIIDALKRVGEEAEAQKNSKKLPDFWNDPEEERRLFYVAVTRARNELDIVVNSSLFSEEYASGKEMQEVSCFVEEMWELLHKPDWIKLEGEKALAKTA